MANVKFSLVTALMCFMILPSICMWLFVFLPPRSWRGFEQFTGAKASPLVIHLAPQDLSSPLNPPRD
jgi:hypothetical protein